MVAVLCYSELYPLQIQQKLIGLYLANSWCIRNTLQTLCLTEESWPRWFFFSPVARDQIFLNEQPLRIPLCLFQARTFLEADGFLPGSSVLTRWVMSHGQYRHCVPNVEQDTSQSFLKQTCSCVCRKEWRRGGRGGGGSLSSSNAENREER